MASTSSTHKTTDTAKESKDMDTSADDVGDSVESKVVKKEDEVWSITPENTPEGDVTLETTDGGSFTIPRAHAYTSKLIRTTLEGDKDEEKIILHRIKKATLANAIRFMSNHKGTELPIIEKPLRSKNMKEVVKCPFDAEFIDEVGVKPQDLYDLILLANYLDLKSLMYLGCAKVATLIKGQPLEKIKDILKPEGGVSSSLPPTSSTSSSSSSSSSGAPAFGVGTGVGERKEEKSESKRS